MASFHDKPVATGPEKFFALPMFMSLLSAIPLLALLAWDKWGMSPEVIGYLIKLM